MFSLSLQRGVSRFASAKLRHFFTVAKYFSDFNYYLTFESDFLSGFFCPPATDVPPHTAWPSYIWTAPIKFTQFLLKKNAPMSSTAGRKKYHINEDGRLPYINSDRSGMLVSRNKVYAEG